MRTIVRAAGFWLLVAFLLFGGAPRGLWTPDEPREAEIGREMLLAPGLVPQLDGVPFLEKPPFYYWLLAGAYAAAGRPSPPAGRALSAAFSLASLAVVWFWTRRAAGRSAAAAAVFVLATMLGFLREAHWILIDPLLALAVLMPARSQGGAADLGLAVTTLELDWFYLALLPLLYQPRLSLYCRRQRCPATGCTCS